MRISSSTVFARCIPYAALALSPGTLSADDVLHRYDADVHPLAAGWVVGNYCEGPCTESVANGHFIRRWNACCDEVNYSFTIANVTEEPPPPPFWVEWGFLSNQPFSGFGFGCDAEFSVEYRDSHDGVYMSGDTVISFEGGDAITGLELNEFHTHRFETADGINYCFFVDGSRLFCRTGYPHNADVAHYVQARGGGLCDLGNLPVVNKWDFVRYGRIAQGEAIVSSDPPAGVVDIDLYPNLDHFTVTFDTPNYVFVDQIAVSAGEGPAPVVTKTRRPVNGPPEVVEIVLDRPLRIGATTTFTFNDGVIENVVEYTLLAVGACCLSDGQCVETDESGCASAVGAFERSGSCQGDADADGVDAACGDQCPDDVAKVIPGQCGCGVPDSDSDADTIADCVDQCPGEDDVPDEDHDGVPDCLDFLSIPATTSWGLVILTLLLLCAGKIASLRRNGLRTIS